MTPLETAQAELARAWPARLDFPLGTHARENAHAWIRALVRRVYLLDKVPRAWPWPPSLRGVR